MCYAFIALNFWTVSFLILFYHFFILLVKTNRGRRCWFMCCVTCCKTLILNGLYYVVQHVKFVVAHTVLTSFSAQIGYAENWFVCLHNLLLYMLCVCIYYVLQVLTHIQTVQHKQPGICLHK